MVSHPGGIFILTGSSVSRRSRPAAAKTVSGFLLLLCRFVEVILFPFFVHFWKTHTHSLTHSRIDTVDFSRFSGVEVTP
jgi:hypothetical protein